MVQFRALRFLRRPPRNHDPFGEGVRNQTDGNLLLGDGLVVRSAVASNGRAAHSKISELGVGCASCRSKGGKCSRLCHFPEPAAPASSRRQLRGIALPKQAQPFIVFQRLGKREHTRDIIDVEGRMSGVITLGIRQAMAECGGSDSNRAMTGSRIGDGPLLGLVMAHPAKLPPNADRKGVQRYRQQRHNRPTHAPAPIDQLCPSRRSSREGRGLLGRTICSFATASDSDVNDRAGSVRGIRGKSAIHAPLTLALTP